MMRAAARGGRLTLCPCPDANDDDNHDNYDHSRRRDDDDDGHHHSDSRHATRGRFTTLRCAHRHTQPTQNESATLY
jgi:hypothetical protein